MSRLPRSLLRLVGRLVPAQEREFVLGDLQEEYQHRLSRGTWSARAWLALQLPRALAWRSAHRRERQPRRPLAALRRDLRFAVRGVRSAPAVAITSVLTLALGIGVNTAIYTLLDHALLRPLPFPDSDRLVRLYNVEPGTEDRWNASFPDYTDLVAATTSFAEIGAWREETPALTVDEGSRAVRVRVAAVTANLPPMLGMEPVVGRTFVAEEDALGRSEGAALLSWGLARDRFGTPQEALDADIRLDGRTYRVVGVLPERFGRGVGIGLLPAWETDIWVAYRSSMAEEGHDLRGLSNVALVGKLASGVSATAAEEELAVFARTLAETWPDFREDSTMALIPAHEVVRERSRGTLWLLYGAVSLILLIAGSNVAHLLLGRNVARGREIAVRMALGGGRGGVIRQVLAESVLLAAAGVVAGWGLGWLLLRVVAASEILTLPGTPDPGLDLRVLVITAAIALALGLVFGTLPAWQTTRRDPSAALRRDDRTATGGSLLRRGLAIAEMALAVTLLIAAALTLQSLARVLDADPGFEAEGILIGRIQMPLDFVDREWPRAVRLFDQLRVEIATLPGVENVAAAYMLPTEPGWNNSFSLPEGIEPPGGEDGVSARFRPVTPGYFELAGIRLLRGRTFTDADVSGNPGVTIVNEAFVRRFLPDVDPLGLQIGCQNWWRAFEGGCEIIGVVADVRLDGRTEPPPPALYFPHSQQPVREMTLMVAAAGDPLDLVPAVRERLERIEPDQPLDDIATLESRLVARDAPRTTIARLLIGFALLALMLAGIGVYGVMSFLVARRTREIGIRMALGAGAPTVRGMVLAEGALLMGLGVFLGGGAAVALSGMLESQLYGVGRYDPVAFVGSATFLAAVGLLACWLPALRATRVDPMRSLRAD